MGKKHSNPEPQVETYDTLIRTMHFFSMDHGNGSCPGYNDMAMYIDGRMSRKDKLRLESHFCGCIECRTQIIEIKQILKLL